VCTAGAGKCTKIPQLPADTEKTRRTLAAPLACATSFPTQVRGGLLFVWMVPGADGLLQSSMCGRCCALTCALHALTCMCTRCNSALGSRHIAHYTTLHTEHCTVYWWPLHHTAH
jgi:hypothetical protein